MLDAYLTSPVTRQRLRSGPAGSHIDGFAAWLHQHGYRPATRDTTLQHLSVAREYAERRGVETHAALESERRWSA